MQAWNVYFRERKLLWVIYEFHFKEIMMYSHNPQIYEFNFHVVDVCLCNFYIPFEPL